MTRVPRPTPGCEIKSLPLKPSEAYLFSRIDASMNERELAMVTGLPPGEVTAALERLVQLGAVTFGDGPVGPAPSGEMPYGSARTSAAGAGRATDTPRPLPSTPPSTPREPPIGRDASSTSSDSPPLYDPAELDEVVEVDVEKKRRILDTYYRLDDLTYYELLSVSEQAEKKQIKSAYYLAAPEFHPDKFFRKKLGSYKAKIETIFARLTLAHDVLTEKVKRAEYDAYLEQTHRNRAMSALLDQAPRDIASVASAVDESAAAMVAGGNLSLQIGGAGPGRYASEVPQSRELRSAQPRAPETEQSRRETLARKLAGRPLRAAHGGPPETGPQPIEPGIPAQPRPAGEGLKALYDAARGEALRLQLARYIEAAKASLERKDYASAANAYRIAASLAPGDVELQRTCAETSQLAAVALAEGFLKQAEYEAQAGHWAEAALSYGKVVTGRPDDARAHERAAFATLKSSNNSRRAVELARRAVELSPKNAEIRVTLARAYSAAGFEKSAEGELARAAELAGSDPRMKELIARARSEPQPTMAPGDPAKGGRAVKASSAPDPVSTRPKDGKVS